MKATARLKIAAQVNIDANALRIANIFVGHAHDIKRPEYDSVLIEPAPFGRGAYLVALDGCCMAVYFDPTAVVKHSHVVSVSVSMSTQLKPGRRFMLTTDDKVLVQTPGEADRAYSHRETFRHPAHRFVAWRKALPANWSDLKPYYPFVLNARYLSKIASLHLESAEMGEVHMLGYPTDIASVKESDLALALFPRNSNLFVVIAPMEAERIVKPVEPAWLNPTDPTEDL